MTTSHDFKASEGIGPKVIAAWRSNKTVREIADQYGKTEGVISGVLTRAKCARVIWKGREAELFNETDSVAFEGLMQRGRSPAEAGELLGKAPGPSLAHARALGLIEGRNVVLRGAALRTSEERKAMETADRPEAMGSAIEEHKAADQRLVDALVLEGGFTRYDDGFDWLLDMFDRRVAPISKGAKAEFLDAMRAKHGDAVIDIAAA